MAAQPTLALLGLAAIFMILTFIVFIGYGGFAFAARYYVITRPHAMTWLRRSFAAAFGLLSLGLAVVDC